MPIRGRVGAAPTPTTAAAAVRSRPEQNVAFRLRNLTTGEVLNLGSDTWKVQPNAYGLDGLTSSVEQVSSPGSVGAVVTGWTADAREVYLPLSSRRESLHDLAAVRAQLREVAPLRQLVRLEVTVDLDGGPRTRWIDGYRIVKGPAAWTAESFGVEGRQILDLLLTCPDPWVRSDVVPFEWEVTPGGGLRLPMRFPMRLRPANLSGRVRPLDVVGDDRSHGVWTLRGPMTEFTAALPGTGESWSMTFPGAGLGVGQVVTVETDPLVGRVRPRVVGPDGSSWWRYVDQPRQLWALPAGRPEVLVTILGATGARAQFDVLPSWESFL